MNSYSLPSILAFTINFSIAIIILLDNPKSKVNRWFAAFVFAFVLWNLSEILILTTSDFYEALFGAQFLYRIIFMLPAFFVAIAYNFPIQTTKIASKVIFYVFLFMIPMIPLAASFPDFKIEIIHLANEHYGYFYKLTLASESLFVVQLIITGAYLVWGTAVLIRKIHRLRTVKQKNQTLFLLTGFIIIIISFVLINLFRLYRSTQFSIYFLNTVFVLSINIFFLFLLVRYKTFNTHNIVKNGIIYSIIYTIILSVYFIVVENLSHSINKIFGINSFLTSAFIIIILVSLIKPLESRLQILLDKFFVKNLEKYRQNYSHLILNMQYPLRPKVLLDKLKHFIKNNFLLEEVTCFLKDDEGNYYCNNLLEDVIPNSFVKRYADFFLSSKRAVQLSEIDLEKTDISFFNKLKKKKTEVILPLTVNDELLAFLFLSEKRYGKKFTEDELVRLTILANEAAIIFHRNLMFENLQKQKEQQFKLEKLAALGQMTAGIAHEIKNPLNTISVSAQNIKKGNLNQEENLELLDYIINEVDRLDKLLKDFLKLSKTLEIKSETVELGNLFAKTINAVESKNIDKVKINCEYHKRTVTNDEAKYLNQIKINCDCQKRIMMKTDPDLLYQVLLNLGLNSIDAILERCKKDVTFNCLKDGIINFFTEDRNDEIIIKVEDNGIGIPKERLNEIFNPFFTTKEEGTGLGLSIVHNIVTSMGGTITVNSQANATSFILTFPKNKKG